MIEASTEAISLHQIPCISYLVQFQKDKIKALINFGNQIDAMTPTYTAKLDLITQKTDVNIQKINSLLLITYEMILIDFLFQISLERFDYLKKLSC